jgi:hypothetical protein
MNAKQPNSDSTLLVYRVLRHTSSGGHVSHHSQAVCERQPIGSAWRWLAVGQLPHRSLMTLGSQRVPDLLRGGASSVVTRHAAAIRAGEPSVCETQSSGDTIILVETYAGW